MGTSATIHHVSIDSATKLQSPHINLSIRDFKVKALIGTGAEISAINLDTCKRLQLTINYANTTTYQDIDNNNAYIVGMAQLNNWFSLTSTTNHSMSLSPIMLTTLAAPQLWIITTRIQTKWRPSSTIQHLRTSNKSNPS
jgi:hypothetical protein